MAHLHRFRLATFCLILSLNAVGAWAQKELIPRQPPPPVQYTLGPGDQVNIRVVAMEEFTDRTVRIDPNGYVDLPMVGRIQASGLTVDQFKDTLSSKLSRYINSPQVSLNLSENQTQTVSVIGSVNSPGIHPLSGPRRLLDVLSLAGGEKPDAGSRVVLTRHHGGQQRHRARLLQLHVHVHGPVLKRLEVADGTAELLALLHVVHRGFVHRRHHADGFGREIAQCLVHDALDVGESICRVAERNTRRAGERNLCGAKTVLGGVAAHGYALARDIHQEQPDA